MLTLQHMKGLLWRKGSETPSANTNRGDQEDQECQEQKKKKKNLNDLVPFGRLDNDIPLSLQQRRLPAAFVPSSHRRPALS